MIHSSAWKKGRLEKGERRGLEATKNPGISPELPHFPNSHPVPPRCQLPKNLQNPQIPPKIPPFPTPHLGAGVLESLTLSKMTESDPKNGKNAWNFVPLDSHFKSCPIPNKNLGLAVKFKSPSQGLGLFGIWFFSVWDLGNL